MANRKYNAETCKVDNCRNVVLIGVMCQECQEDLLASMEPKLHPKVTHPRATLASVTRWCELALRLLMKKGDMTPSQWDTYLKIWEFAAQCTHLPMRDFTPPSEIRIVDDSPLPDVFAEFINGLDI